MKVTALVTLSLLSALLLLDLEPTCGIRLNEHYSNGDKSLADSHGLGQSSTKEHHHGSGGMSSESSTSSSSSNNGRSSSTSNVMVNSGSSAANKLSHSKARSNNKHTESIEDLLESGLWQVPIQLWNYLPHTNSINNHHANVQIVDHHGKLNRHHELENDPAVDIDEDEEDEGGMVRGATNGRHHLSFIPDPDNSVSIHMPSSHAFLGQRLAGLNGKHFADLTSQDYTHEDAGGGKPPAILKRTHSDNGPVGNRKTEDRKRANRPYDVPQIECPPADDGMERFACPSPDRQGRYRCIDDHVLCDGFLDCPEGEDEDRHACMFYKTTKAHLDVLADALLRWARGKR